MRIRKLSYHNYSLVCIIVVNLIFNLFGLPEDIKFRRLSIEEGLSQSSVFCLTQDDNGFIYAGTESGINKYNGYEFTIYDSDAADSNSLTNLSISSMCRDRNGIIWIGTAYGLNRYDPRNESFEKFFHDPDDSNSICDNLIHSICEGHDGSIWIGTNAGLNQYNYIQDNFYHYHADTADPNSINDDIVRIVYTDKSGTLWAGTERGGLCRLDSGSDTFITYANDPRDPSTLSHNTVLSLCEDHTGLLWIGTDGGGLNTYDRKTETFSLYSHDPGNPGSLAENNINVIFEDKSHLLWIGTNNSGLNLFDRGNNSFIHFTHSANNQNSLGDIRILSIFEDKDGGLWFGTDAAGISLYIKKPKKFAHYYHNPENPKGLGINTIWDIFEDRSGNIWIGTDGKGIYRYNRTTDEFTNFLNNPHNTNSLSDNIVYNIYEDKYGVMWIATKSGGLNKFIPQIAQFVHYTHNPKDSFSISSNWPFCIYEDSMHTLWVGTNGGGLNSFDRKNNRFIRYQYDQDDTFSISANRIFDITGDQKGTLWIGTYGGGLNRYDRKESKFYKYKHDIKNSNSLAHNFILSLYCDRSGILWAGTKNGVSRFNVETEEFTNYTTKHGLPEKTVYDIVEDHRGNLWLSTNRGLARFNPESKEVKVFTADDGLQSNEFNTGTGLLSRSGEVFFGGINGFNRFHPDSIKDNPTIPSVAITDFQIFNNSVPIGEMADGRTILNSSIVETEDITLSYKDNVFSFEFAALHFVAPEKNQYAYMMEGLEREWNFVGNRRFASYTGIPPGKYTFKVKGSNNDGVWNEKGASINITIIPPFWSTWWFFSLCIIAFVFIVGTVFLYQIDKIKRQKEEEQRLKVITDVSHILEHGRATVYRRNVGSETYEYMGDGIKEITGYDPKEFSLPFWNHIVISIQAVGETAHLTEEEAYEQMNQGKLKSFIMDFSFRTKSGEVRWIRDITMGLKDEGGQYYTYLGIMFDITDRKVAEQELAKANQEMETDLNMAREVQQTFLEKQPPQFPENVPVEKSAVQFYHRYVPATSLAGDFFNIIPISKQKVGMLICDVMGHGARASLLTAYIQGQIEELMPIAADPSAFMKKLNDGLNSIMYQFATGIFATVFYMVIDIKTRRISYTNAGHPKPIILRRSKGVVENIFQNGRGAEPALGLTEDYKYTVYKGPVDKDDIILFFTDGVYEVENSEEQIFGRKRLLSSVESHLTLHPDKLLDGIIKEIQSFTENQDFKDDVCLVSMHVGHGVD